MGPVCTHTHTREPAALAVQTMGLIGVYGLEEEEEGGSEGGVNALKYWRQHRNETPFLHVMHVWLGWPVFAMH